MRCRPCLARQSQALPYPTLARHAAPFTLDSLMRCRPCQASPNPAVARLALPDLVTISRRLLALRQDQLRLETTVARMPVTQPDERASLLDNLLQFIGIQPIDVEQSRHLGTPLPEHRPA